MASARLWQAFCAVGVYLGLVWRFNSADVLHPRRLLIIGQVLVMVTHSPVLMGLILAFAVGLWGMYFLFDIWMEGALARARAARDRRRARRQSS